MVPSVIITILDCVCYVNDMILTESLSVDFSGSRPDVEVSWSDLSED